MQVIKASELFKNMQNLDDYEFEQTRNINLDFSNIDTIDLKALTTLLNMQKVALLNNKSLSISNVKPDVRKVLDITGINKTFDNVATNPISKRQK
jgi:anti-anti-sigma regulatory factor